jgi:hypothetical protein
LLLALAEVVGYVQVLLILANLEQFQLFQQLLQLEEEGEELKAKQKV